MSDDESIVLLSESDEDDEVKEVPKDDCDDEEEEKVNPKEIQLYNRDVDENAIVLKVNPFVKNKITQKEGALTIKQDMTTQTDEDFPQNQSENLASLSTTQVSSSGNTNIASTVSNREEFSIKEVVEGTENKSTKIDCRSRNSSVTSNCNNGQCQNKTNTNTGTLMSSRYFTQKPRIYGNGNVRVQPYSRSNQSGQQNSRQQNRPNYNFINNYNRFGIPSPNYNNFNRQILSVRERYIEQFKEYLHTSFGHFLNNTLPFNFPQECNTNFSQGSSNNFPQDSINNIPQNNNDYSQGNFPRGINNFPQDSNNFPPGNYFRRNIN